MRDRPLIAYHFGPRLDYVGGIASVIQTLVNLAIGADVVRAIPTWWQPGSHLRSAQLAARAIRVVFGLPRTTVVHVHLSHGGSFMREAAVLASARTRHMPRVVTIHGSHFVDFSRRWPRLVTQVLGMANAVTVLSESDLEAVRALVPTVHVELVPNPVPLDLDARRTSDTAELVLFAGELGTRKGADVLHRAWAAVSRQRPSATCIMVGPATHLALADLERLQVHGPVSTDCVRELIRKARVIALPSRGEVLPMILTEAMAAGRPFVSTPVGGVASLAAGGILVPVNDHLALADALIQLLSDPAQAESLGNAGQALCKQWMAPDSVDASLRRIYLNAFSPSDERLAVSTRRLS